MQLEFETLSKSMHTVGIHIDNLSSIQACISFESVESKIHL